MSLIYFSASAIGFAIGFGALAVTHAGVRERRLIERRVMELSGYGPRDNAGETRIDMATRILTRIAFLLTRDIEGIARLVQAAGMFNFRAVYWFLGARFLTMILFGALALSISTFLGVAAKYVVLAAAVGATLGVVTPTYLLTNAANRRRRRFRRELPLFLDSLKLLLQSGVSIEIALRHISRMELTVIPEIQRSLRPLEEDLDQGRDYVETFERWADRFSISEAKEMVGLLLQSLQYGGETIPMLSTMVNELIERRLSDARLIAGKRSVVLTLAMVVLFLPPLVLIVIGPAAIGIVRSITGVGG